MTTLRRIVNMAGPVVIGIFMLFYVQTAGAVVFYSSGGTATCELGGAAGSGACTLQTITPHARWQPDLVDAKWVSYANTGITGGTAAPRDTDDPLMIVRETWNISGNSTPLELYVWADDTASVWLDGVQKIAMNSTQNICANGSIGCEPDEFGYLSENLAAGSHTLEFRVFQIGTGTTSASNPYGLLYRGEIGGGASQTQIPAPPVMALPGFGLLVLVYIRRYWQTA